MKVDVDTLIVAATSEGPERVRAAARLMTLAESGLETGFDLLGRLAGAPEPRLVLGLTGAPGSGKSLLVDRLLTAFRAKYPERRIGVIAVDPSSPYSNGAFLGDRVRMMRHATDPQVFIRSAATRGHLGGLALGVFGILKVMGLAGSDAVLIETAGVGQMEIEVKSLSDFVLVILAPGQGDVVQFMKAGLMEAGDVFLVNKADCPQATEFHAQLLASLRLLGRKARPLDDEAVRLVSARTERGIGELLDYLERRRIDDSENRADRREKILRVQIEAAILELARHKLEADWSALTASDPIGRVLRGEADIAALSRELLQRAAAG